MSQPIDLRPVGTVGIRVEDLTDEDSGDEEYLNNLPGSQLLAPAEVMTKDTDVDEDADIKWPTMSKVESQLPSATELFLRFSNEEVIDVFVFWSNNYATKKIEREI
ncbi:hypothetical protein NQ318_011829 [Aromia moschata]|uniref:Uncharacterized protein n=1 Tax=Aromia moschata TaxID=1265417 RepID=A0AAV8XR16_9CUCU|nr:hypothetical protein NQ318_011829 [Aromia moschata]